MLNEGDFDRLTDELFKKILIKNIKIYTQKPKQYDINFKNNLRRQSYLTIIQFIIILKQHSK